MNATYEQMIEHIEDAAHCIRDEYGEWLHQLVCLNRHVDDCASDEFQAAYWKEVTVAYSYLIENYEKVEEEQTKINTVIKFRLKEES